jgi:hypothetical protein
MVKKCFSYALVAVAIFGFATVYAIDIEPSDDMTTDPDQHSIPASELWTADYDFAGHHERINIRFDLDAYAGQQVDSAYLNIYRFFRCPNHYYTIAIFYHITQAWNESTWPQNVHSPHGTSPWLIYNFGPDLGWYRIDITSLVQAWLDGDIDNYGFVIQAQYDEKFSKFYSKEASNDMQPYLELFVPTSIDEINSIPDGFMIKAFPNPFNVSTSIQYNLPEISYVTIDIFDLLGCNVVTLVNGKQPAGYHQTIWEAKDYPSGIYLYRFKANNHIETNKVLLLK